MLFECWWEVGLACLAIVFIIISTLVQSLKANVRGERTRGLIFLAQGLRCGAWDFDFGLGHVVVACRVVGVVKSGAWGLRSRGSS